MSTCCLNEIDCVLLLSCLGMDLCLEDDRELGIKGEGKKGVSAPYVNLKVQRHWPSQRHWRSGGLLALLLWAGLRCGFSWRSAEARAAPWAPARCTGECPVLSSSALGCRGPVPVCHGAGWMGAPGRLLLGGLPLGGLAGAAMGLGHRRMARTFIALHFLCVSCLWIAVT